MGVGSLMTPCPRGGGAENVRGGAEWGEGEAISPPGGGGNIRRATLPAAWGAGLLETD